MAISVIAKRFLLISTTINTKKRIETDIISTFVMENSAVRRAYLNEEKNAARSVIIPPIKIITFPSGKNDAVKR